MTELSPVSHVTPPGQFKPGSVGVTLPNTETRVVDPATGDDLDLGVDGEVWVRGPQVMKGYLNNEQATAATITDDGWLRTGDIGRIDEDGHLFIVDRLKELIKYKGFQVPPAELEAVLAHATRPSQTPPWSASPTRRPARSPSAYVVLQQGADATAEQVMDFVAGEVAHYKQVRRLEFIEAIPKSASGKLLRRELKRQALGDPGH